MFAATSLCSAQPASETNLNRGEHPPQQAKPPLTVSPRSHSHTRRALSGCTSALPDQAEAL
jgi:hypothetical protein